MDELSLRRGLLFGICRKERNSPRGTAEGEFTLATIGSGDAVLRAMSHPEWSGTSDKTGDTTHNLPSDTLLLEAANPTIASA
jgi:hypothetical protein